MYIMMQTQPFDTLPETSEAAFESVFILGFVTFDKSNFFLLGPIANPLPDWGNFQNNTPCQ